eukprot:2974551-Pyramimonas_sp.AAC.1
MRVALKQEPNSKHHPRSIRAAARQSPMKRPAPELFRNEDEHGGGRRRGGRETGGEEGNGGE